LLHDEEDLVERIELGREGPPLEAVEERGVEILGSLPRVRRVAAEELDEAGTGLRRAGLLHEEGVGRRLEQLEIRRPLRVDERASAFDCLGALLGRGGSQRLEELRA